MRLPLFSVYLKVILFHCLRQQCYCIHESCSAYCSHRCSGCLMQIDRTARRQLAVMRWQHARAVLACEHQQSLIKLPSAKTHGVLQQVFSLYFLHCYCRQPSCQLPAGPSV